MRLAQDKIKTLPSLKPLLASARSRGLRVVFTNGCFDLIHPGHVRYLQKARLEGDCLVVALNSDRSVRALKGSGRPVLSENERCEVVGALECVDWVIVFDQETPLEIIQELSPDVLAKGGDWPVEQIVGRRFVEANGGKVISIQFEEGNSTSRIIERIRASN